MPKITDFDTLQSEYNEAFNFCSLKAIDSSIVGYILLEHLGVLEAAHHSILANCRIIDSTKEYIPHIDKKEIQRPNDSFILVFDTAHNYEAEAIHNYNDIRALFEQKFQHLDLPRRGAITKFYFSIPFSAAEVALRASTLIKYKSNTFKKVPPNVLQNYTLLKEGKMPGAQYMKLLKNEIVALKILFQSIFPQLMGRKTSHSNPFDIKPELNTTSHEKLEKQASTPAQPTKPLEPKKENKQEKKADKALQTEFFTKPTTQDIETQTPLDEKIKHYKYESNVDITQVETQTHIKMRRTVGFQTDAGTKALTQDAESQTPLMDSLLLNKSTLFNNLVAKKIDHYKYESNALVKRLGKHKNAIAEEKKAILTLALAEFDKTLPADEQLNNFCKVIRQNKTALITPHSNVGKDIIKTLITCFGFILGIYPGIKLHKLFFAPDRETTTGKFVQEVDCFSNNVANNS